MSIVEMELTSAMAETVRRAIVSSSVGPHTHYEEFRRRVASSIVPVLSQALGALIELRASPRSPPILLLRGLPVEPTAMEATAESDEALRLGVTLVSEACLIAVALVLGEPFSFRQESGGRLFRAIFPREEATELDDVPFGCHRLRMHTEIAWSKARPDYVLFYWVRAHPDQRWVTSAASATDAIELIAPEHVEVLRQPRFQLGLPESLRKEIDEAYYWTDSMPLITGPSELPEVRVNFNYARSIDPRGSMALAELERALIATSEVIEGKPGDLLVLDNRRAVHARKRFVKQAEGRDRWVQQLYVVKDPWRIRECCDRFSPMVVDAMKTMQLGE